MNESFSKTSGVPQGSIYWVQPYFYYTSIISLNLKYLTLILYADDTNLFFKSRNLNNAFSEISYDLVQLNKWCQTNKLTINDDEICYMIF